MLMNNNKTPAEVPVKYWASNATETPAKDAATTRTAAVTAVSAPLQTPSITSNNFDAQQQQQQSSNNGSWRQPIWMRNNNSRPWEYRQRNNYYQNRNRNGPYQNQTNRSFAYSHFNNRYYNGYNNNPKWLSQPNWSERPQATDSTESSGERKNYQDCNNNKYRQEQNNQSYYRSCRDYNAKGSYNKYERNFDETNQDLNGLHNNSRDDAYYAHSNVYNQDIDEYRHDSNYCLKSQATQSESNCERAQSHGETTKDHLDLVQSASKPCKSKKKAKSPQKKCTTVNPHTKESSLLEVSEENQQSSNAAERLPRKEFKPIANIRTRCVSTSSAELCLNERLANMNKEGLKHIINNGNIIYDAHLKVQARKRRRDEICRQIKEMELEQPKKNNTTLPLEENIVDAIELPAIDLPDPTVERLTTEQAKETQELEKDMSKDSTSSTDLMRRLKIAEEFKTMAAKRGRKSSTASQLNSSPKICKQSAQKTSESSQIEDSPKKAKTSGKHKSKTRESPGKSSKQKVCIPPVQVSPTLSSKAKTQADVEDINAETVATSLSKATAKMCPSLNDEENGLKENVSISDDDDEAASDASNCSSVSVAQQLKLDAESVVSRFEELILPQMSTKLKQRYRRFHSNSLDTRLIFVSSICTSNLFNSKSFSKTEIYKLQRNIKARNNRMAIDFLQRELVNVMKTLEKQAANELSSELLINETKSAEQAAAADLQPTEVAMAADRHQTNTAATHAEAAPVKAANLPQNVAPASVGVITNGVYPLMPGQLPHLPLLPFMELRASNPVAPSVSATLPLGAVDNMEQNWQCGPNDLVSHSLCEIDRRLLDNQVRRKFLEEMILKFQKEKSDLEMVSLELQSRKFLLLNAVIAHNINPAEGSKTAVPQFSPKTEKEESTNEKHNRTQRRTIVVKRVNPTKRKLIVKRKPKKSNKHSSNLNTELQRNVEHLAENSSDTETITMPLPSIIKEEVLEPIDAASCNGNPSNSALNTTRQPFAVVPPLPPASATAPVELATEVTYNFPRILLRAQPATTYTPNAIHTISNSLPNYECVQSGPLTGTYSAISQLCIHKMSIIAAAENGDIYVFNIGNHKLERQITKHSDAITNMVICPEKSFLYTTSLDSFLKKSSLENLESAQHTVYFREPLQSVDIAWNKAFIGSRYGNVFTFDVTNNKASDKPFVSTGHSIIVLKTIEENDCKIIVLGCKGNVVFMHNAKSGLLIRRLDAPLGLNVYALLLDEGYVYCGTQKNEIYKYDFATGNHVGKLSSGNGAISMAIYKDKYLLAGCYDGYIYVLDKHSNKQLGKFEGSGRMVLALAIVGDKIVTSARDNSIKIMDIPPDLLHM